MSAASGDSSELEPLLVAEGLQTYYGESHILEGVSFDIRAGEVVALVGRNGVGKTTTLRSILQLTPPREGSIRYRGEELIGQQPHEVTERGIRWIPEDRRIFSDPTVEENLRIASVDTEHALYTAYETFPDLERFAQRKAGALSGGQQQMLAIARALIGDNDLLLVDEPSEGLCATNCHRGRREHRSTEQTVLLVEQNLPLAFDLADRFYALDNGRIVESGTTDNSADDALPGTFPHE